MLTKNQALREMVDAAREEAKNDLTNYRESLKWWSELPLNLWEKYFDEYEFYRETTATHHTELTLHDIEVIFTNYKK